MGKYERGHGPCGDHGGSYASQITAEGPCPPGHHHRSILPSATWPPSRKMLRMARRGCWRCWLRWPIRGGRLLAGLAALGIEMADVGQQLGGELAARLGNRARWPDLVQEPAGLACADLVWPPPGISSHSTACSRQTAWLRARDRSRCLWPVPSGRGRGHRRSLPAGWCTTAPPPPPTGHRSGRSCRYSRCAASACSTTSLKRFRLALVIDRRECRHPGTPAALTLRSQGSSSRPALAKGSRSAHGKRGRRAELEACHDGRPDFTGHSTSNASSPN